MKELYVGITRAKYNLVMPSDLVILIIRNKVNLFMYCIMNNNYYIFLL